MSERIPRSTCRSCSEPIMWVRTRDGKRMPVDVEADQSAGNLDLYKGEAGNGFFVRVITGGPLAEARRTGRPRLYRSHFSSCPRADRHRRRVDDQCRARETQPPNQAGLFDTHHPAGRNQA